MKSHGGRQSVAPATDWRPRTTGRSAGVALLLLLAVSCGGSTTPAPPSPSSFEPSPPFEEVLSASKAIEYEVTYQFTSTGPRHAFIGEQSWYFKQGSARFDLKRTIAGQASSVSLFALPDGTFMCIGTGTQAECTGISGLETALQQNPAAFYQASLIAHPEQFSAVLVGTRHIADTHAHCYDVRPLAGSSGLPDARFCYSKLGIPLVLRISAQPDSGQWRRRVFRRPSRTRTSCSPAKPTIARP